jgi:hypothetical protein
MRARLKGRLQPAGTAEVVESETLAASEHAQAFKRFLLELR